MCVTFEKGGRRGIITGVLLHESIFLFFLFFVFFVFFCFWGFLKIEITAYLNCIFDWNHTFLCISYLCMGGEVGGECMGMGRGGDKDEGTYKGKMGEMNKLPPPPPKIEYHHLELQPRTFWLCRHESYSPTMETCCSRIAHRAGQYLLPCPQGRSTLKYSGLTKHVI